MSAQASEYSTKKEGRAQSPNPKFKRQSSSKSNNPIQNPNPNNQNRQSHDTTLGESFEQQNRPDKMAERESWQRAYIGSDTGAFSQAD